MHDAPAPRLRTPRRHAQMGGNDSKEDVMKVFNMYDDDKTGKISMANLKRVAKELGENMSDANLKSMLEHYDKDKVGGITFENFYRVMKKKASGIDDLLGDDED